MTSVVEFLDRIRSLPVPDGFGLIFCDLNREGSDVIQVDNPRFCWPMPLEDMERCRRLVVISPEICDEFVASLSAVPIPHMSMWYRFAMWDESNVDSD